ncbi:hypothetical protein [Spongiibacter marinus]|uniref:hypothetical protein n=1 Tax=Spongiibacter marinus TaxID=354246 RepID=UPI0019602AAC|nr:hypothetical protein [Spongiibacter marinus]MBM7424980.1 hypothetical protein [Spongiibacter marinus]
MQKKYKNARRFFTVRDFTAAEIQEIAGVDATTARRYRRQNDAPEPVWRLLALVACGYVVPDKLADCMRFDLAGERLELDSGESFDLGELLAWHFNKQAMASELFSLRARVDRLQRLEVIRGAAQRGGLRLLEKPAPKHGSEVAQPAPYYRGSDPIRWRSGA